MHYARRITLLASLLTVSCTTSQHGILATPVAPQSNITHAAASSTAPPAGFDFPGPKARTNSTLTTVYTFGSGTDAAGVQAKMANVNGILYGTSHGGGTMGKGTIFTYNTQTGVERVIYNFLGGTDGWGPEAFLQLVKGTFYGTTSAVPEPGFPDGEGNGTVFAVSKTGSERVLHAFSGSPDGANPEGFVFAVNGILYGTTFVGGTGSCSYSSSQGCGTVFRVNPTTGDERVIYSFRGGSDGAGPRAGLAFLNGTLYGSTYFGGTSGLGTVFSITPAGVEHVIHSFSGGADGSRAQSALTAMNGVLYGSTNQGGSTSYGVVYSITPSGAEKVIQSVCCGPEGGVNFLNSMMYGTTSGNGSPTGGNVFSLGLDGTETVLYSFTGDQNGASPEDAPSIVNGVLYGTTRLGGTNGVGTIFKLTP